MDKIGYLEAANVFFAGLLAGAEVVIHYGTAIPYYLLAESAQIQVRQAMVRRLRVLVPILFLPTLLTTGMLAAMYKITGQIVLQGASLGCLLVWISVRVFATVRINSATVEWDATAPPAGWKELVARAERFHILGVWAAVCAFLLLLIAVVPHR